MKSGTILKTSFIVGFIITFLGAYLKIIHAEGADTWLLIGIIISGIFIITAIYEIIISKRIDNTEKTLWTIGLFLFSSIAGLIYILVGRRKIANNI